MAYSALYVYVGPCVFRLKHRQRKIETRRTRRVRVDDDRHLAISASGSLRLAMAGLTGLTGLVESTLTPRYPFMLTFGL